MAGTWEPPGIGILGQSYIYTFSHFIPNDWPTTALPIEVAQLTVHPDDGETWRSPVLDWGIVDGHWRLASRWDSNPITTSETAQGIFSRRACIRARSMDALARRGVVELGRPRQARGFCASGRTGKKLSTAPARIATTTVTRGRSSGVFMRARFGLPVNPSRWRTISCMRTGSRRNWLGRQNLRRHRPRRRHHHSRLQRRVKLRHLGRRFLRRPRSRMGKGPCGQSPATESYCETASTHSGAPHNSACGWSMGC